MSLRLAGRVRVSSVWARMVLLVAAMAVFGGVIVLAHVAASDAFDRRHRATRLELELVAVHQEALQFLRRPSEAFLEQAMSRLQTAQALLSGSDQDRQADLPAVLASYALALWALRTSFVARGLDENQGAEGALRRSVHAVEEVVREAKTADIHIAMLTARRAEKDFILRRQPQYVDRVHAAVAEVLLRTDRARLRPAQKAEIVSRILAYRDEFDRFVGLLGEVDREVEEMDAVESRVKVHLQHLVERENQRVEALRASAFAALGTACGLGFVLSLILARSLLRPLRGMVDAARRISVGEPGVSLEPRGGEELEALAHALNAVSLHEEALRTARAQAEAAAEAKSRFLANMSHEMRTPLNAVIGLSTLLSREGLAPRELDTIEAIRSSGEHLLSVIDSILRFTKLEAGHERLHPADTDLRALVAGVGRMLEPIATEGVRVVVEVAEEVPARVRLDPTSLQQVLLDLAGNAVKFTVRGEVRLEVRLGSTSTDPMRLEFRVEDTGIGIPPDWLDRIFRPFEQVDASSTRAHGGTGLGLVIARQLVRLMGGDIHVLSTEGVGSIFTFDIVAERALDAPVAPAPAEAHDRPDLHSLRVLLVEDNLVNQKVALRILERFGVEPRVAGDGAQALEQLGREDYDIVLMDLQMPVMNGLEATRRIRADLPAHRQPKVIALTANALDTDREACIRAGMDAFLAKPVRPQELEDALRRVREAP